jgi:hypothetical protein
LGLVRKSLIREAMREISRQRMVKLTQKQRTRYASKAGKAWWSKLTEEERAARIALMVAARKKKRK